MTKAWDCYCDALESSMIIFAENAIVAREIAEAEQDSNEYYIDVKRASKFDKYYPKVPPKVLIEEEGWWWKCNYCSEMLGNYAEDLDMNDVVYGDDEEVFCNSDCHAKYIEKLIKLGFIK